MPVLGVVTRPPGNVTPAAPPGFQASSPTVTFIPFWAYHSLPGRLRKTSWVTSRSRWQLPAPPTSGLADPPPIFLFQNEITHDEHCAACKRGANLQPCGTCPGAYHLSCLDPPLKTAPKGVWVCPKCQQKVWEAVSPVGEPLPLHNI